MMNEVTLEPCSHPAREFPAGVAIPEVDAVDEWVNSLTHAIGTILSLFGLVALVMPPWYEGDYWRCLTFGIFGVTLILLYGASTLYHAVRHPAYKERLRIADHCAIYLLIAGSYTPFTLLVLEGVWRWGLLGAVWGLAGCGVAFKILSKWRLSSWSTGLYLAMGWLIVVAAEPLASRLHPTGLFLLMAGGGCYTFGVIFYLLDKRRFYHAIWHLFVMGGSACHYCAAFFYL